MGKMMLLQDGVAVLDGGDALSGDVIERGLVCDLMVEADIIPILKRGMWIVDAGAALGDHTRAYLDAAGSTGVVFAFEPHPEYYKCLKHNCPKAISANRALWSESFVSLYHHSWAGNVGAGMVNTDSGSSSPREDVYGPIETVCLDDYRLKKLDYIKLDVEGTELIVMRGAMQTIKRCKPLMVIEMVSGSAAAYGRTHEDVYNLLDELHYEHRPIRGSQNQRCSDCDILAWHKSVPEPWKRQQ